MVSTQEVRIFLSILEFQFLRDYDSSVTRRSEIIDCTVSRPSSCSISENDDPSESLMTIRSYRDSLKQRRSSTGGHAPLPVPSVQLMTATDSTVSFFPVESDEEQRIRKAISTIY